MGNNLGRFISNIKLQKFNFHPFVGYTIIQMEVILLAGGLGTRMTEYTKTIPKPIVKLGGKPILEHIMDHYYKYGQML